MTWHEFIKEQKQQQYYKNIKYFLLEQWQKKNIYPAKNLILRAFGMTPLDKVKIVILGQDPYPGKGQANGLAFSVPPYYPIPPSLRNIFRELKRDTGRAPVHGDLSSWAKQGVLLLNTTLTVEENRPHSHKDIGWSIFTTRALRYLASQRKGIIFLLWGNYAKKVGSFLDRNEHFVLTSGHPSPLSYDKFFKNNQHFLTTNHILKSNQLGAIEWCIS